MRIYKLGGAKVVLLLFMCVLCIPHITLFVLCRNRIIIKQDVERWMEITAQGHYNIVLDIVFLLAFFKEFRNIYYLRIGRLSFLLKYLRPLSSLYINTSSKDFGAGTFVQHGFSTVITAERIGKNCWINQQVTIGYNNSRRNGLGKPTIGDNVRIAAGAKVCGKIIIGDNCIIGTNAVVVKDVPPDSIVIPSPSMLLQEKGEKTYKKL